MASSRKSNYTRKRASDPLERRMDQWLETGRQFVDGVAGNRPGQRRQSNLGINRSDIDNVGRWVGDKLDWLFEEEDDWIENAEYGFQSRDNSPGHRKPLEAISLRMPRAISSSASSLQETHSADDWPDESSFRIDRWQRDEFKEKNMPFANDLISERKSPSSRPLPKSSRRRN